MLQSEIKLVECLAYRVSESLYAIDLTLCDATLSFQDRVKLTMNRLELVQQELAKLTQFHLEVAGV